MRRLGTHPTERSAPEDRCNTDVTCPEVYGTDEGAVVFQGTKVEPEDIRNEVPLEDRGRYDAAVARLGKGATVVVLSRSALLDALADIETFVGESNPKG